MGRCGALALAWLLVSGCRSSQPAEVASWFEPADPTRIVGPIHFVGTRGLAAYLITTPEGHLLLGGAMPPSAKLVERNIRELGLKPEDIKVLLTFHAHIDHVGTHAHFKKLSGAQVAMMSEEVALLESGGRTDFHYGHLPSFYFPPVRVDRALHDGDRVTLGDVVLTARHTPGHTRGATTWTTTVTEAGKAYVVVFPDGTTINPGYRLARHPSYPGMAADYRRSVALHASLRPDIWLAAHTSFFEFEAKRARAEREGTQAWVDPEGYRNWVIERKDVVEKTIATEMREGS
jgi:metallo-beta-lactamase class B